MTDTPDAIETMKALTERTLDYDYTVWFWGDAIAVDGLLDSAEITGDSAPVDRCREFLEQWARRPLTYVDHLTPGAGLLRLAQLTGDAALDSAAVRLGEFLQSAPRLNRVPMYRPDIPSYRHAVWVDTLYHVPPFYARLAHLTGHERWFDAAVEEWVGHVKVLSNPEEGPFLGHSWDTGSRVLHGYGWGRGVGWALYGLVEMLEQLPEDHPKREALRHELYQMASSVVKIQDPTGFWRTLIHDRESYLESSTASFFGAALAKAVRLGLLGVEFMPAAELAWQATLARVDADGSFWGVSACTYAGVNEHDDVTMYRTLPTEVNVWGQGSALRIAAEFARTDVAVSA